MSEFVFKMPDLGEGTVDAEIVAWHAKPGDAVTEDQLIVEVMTDKAAVEVPAPVSGRVVSITGGPGDKVAVGSPLIVFEVGESPAAPVPATPRAAVAPATVATRDGRTRSGCARGGHDNAARRSGAGRITRRAPRPGDGVAGESAAGA